MIPPLSQSRQALMACPYLYTEAVVEGHRAPPTLDSKRGQEIHEVLSTYVRHLAKTRQQADYEEFDRLVDELVNLRDALDVLAMVRERLTIDPEKVWQTEVHILLDDAFQVIDDGALPPRPSYEMTLDLVLVHDPVTGEIQDYKSHYRTFDPDTFQAKLYSLGLLKLNPKLEKVYFRLEFVRWGIGRSVTYTRDDVPKLEAEARKWRKHQLKLHEASAQLRIAQPGSHCVYCPLLGNGCPLGERNPYAEMSLEERLRQVVYMREAVKKGLEVIKDHCAAEGPLEYTDDAGNRYRAEWGVKDRKSFPLVEALPILDQYQRATRDEILPKLTISGLGTLLRAKKRQDLADELANVAEVRTGARFQIGRMKGEKVEDEEEGNGE